MEMCVQQSAWMKVPQACSPLCPCRRHWEMGGMLPSPSQLCRDYGARVPRPDHRLVRANFIKRSERARCSFLQSAQTAHRGEAGRYDVVAGEQGRAWRMNSNNATAVQRRGSSPLSVLGVRGCAPRRDLPVVSSGVYRPVRSSSRVLPKVLKTVVVSSGGDGAVALREPCSECRCSRFAAEPSHTTGRVLPT